MTALPLPPYVLSRAIDEGLKAEDSAALYRWVAVLFAVGVLIAYLGILRHRTMAKVRLDAAFRTARTVLHHSNRLGAVLPRRVSDGEVAAIGMSDVYAIARSLTVTGPGVGAVAAYAAVAMLLLSISPLLAVVVLAGVPCVAVLMGPLLNRLLNVDSSYRGQQGELTARLVDIVTGLRVLNGIGGKDLLAARFHRESRSLRATGYRVGAADSWVLALGSGLPALFLAVVTWIASRMAAAGAITVGDLVAVYGYASVLVVPVGFAISSSSDISRALVAARRVVDFLGIQPHISGTATPLDAPPSGSGFYDPDSGLRVRAGVLTALTGARPQESARIAERLGRFTPSRVSWGPVPLHAVRLDHVRDRILLADNDAELFSGTLREVVRGRCESGDDAIRAAAADDVVESLTGGFDARVAASGGNLSGGQIQRLRLARALYCAPEVLLAVDPTSAVDAHTEAAVASRLRGARQGMTTVVTTTSPLVLDRADEVAFLVDGRVAATGTHRELARTDPRYRAAISRDADEEALR